MILFKFTLQNCFKKSIKNVNFITKKVFSDDAVNNKQCTIEENLWDNPEKYALPNNGLLFIFLLNFFIY